MGAARHSVRAINTRRWIRYRVAPIARAHFATVLATRQVGLTCRSTGMSSNAQREKIESVFRFFAPARGSAAPPIKDSQAAPNLTFFDVEN
jgi:hypothetical protein